MVMETLPPLVPAAAAPDGGVATTNDPTEDAGGVEQAPPVWSPAVPAARYGALDGGACARQLAERGIASATATAVGVDRPLRIAGALHGIVFHGAGVASGSKRSIFEVADCRLVLALDDFAAQLARRGIVAVDHFSMYRPLPTPSARRNPKGVARHQPKRRTGKPSQHALGLAIDIGAFVKADGSRLVIKTDWHGAIGDAPCAAPPREPTPEALELRSIVCEARRAGLFNVILTPDANVEHADHVHLDITRDARWFILE
jgi:hypothetical protein